MAVAAIFATASASRADALADITARGTIRVAVPQDFPPFGSVGTDMAPMGYDIDMANLIAEKLGVKTELVPVTSANRIPYLQTNKVDLVISSLGKNAEREKVIDFSVAYAPFFNGVFAPADVAVTKAEDLAGKTIGVTRGAVEDLELTKIAPADAVIKRYEDNNGTISAFLSGQVDASRDRQRRGGRDPRQEPAEAPGAEVPDQELALLHRPQQGTSRRCSRRSTASSPRPRRTARSTPSPRSGSAPISRRPLTGLTDVIPRPSRDGDAARRPTKRGTILELRFRIRLASSNIIRSSSRAF